MKANFQAALAKRLENANVPTDYSPEAPWEKLKTVILQTSIEILGFFSRKNSGFMIAM